MEIYIRKEDLQRVWESCDLGKSVGVRVYMQPNPEFLQAFVRIKVDYRPTKEQQRDID